MKSIVRSSSITPSNFTVTEAVLERVANARSAYEKHLKDSERREGCKEEKGRGRHVAGKV